MTPGAHTTDDPTLAVVVARLEDLRSDVAGLRHEVTAQQAGYLARTEFEAWRTGIGREIGDIKASVVRVETDVAAARASADSRRPAWPAVVAAVGAVIAATIALIPRLVA